MRPFGRPSLIAVGTFVSGFGGVVVLASLSVAALGHGSYEISGQPVTPGEFVRRAGPFLGMLGVILLVLARGFHRADPRSRWLALAFWLYIGIAALWVANGNAADIWMTLGYIAFFLGISGWYFFRKRNVVEYFTEVGDTDA